MKAVARLRPLGILGCLALSACSLLSPAQPTATRLLHRSGFEWITDSTEHFNIHYEARSSALLKRELVETDVESSFDHVMHILNESSYTAVPIEVFIVESRTRMKALIGYETNGIAFPGTNVLCYIVSNDMMLSARHELLHVIAMNVWGTPEIWINEGLAVYADDHWHNHDLHELAGYLYRTGEMISIEHLTGRFQSQNDLVAYPLAGSLVKYIYEEYGLVVVKAVWQGGDGAFEKATGKDMHVLEREWHEHLSKQSTGISDYTF